MFPEGFLPGGRSAVHQLDSQVASGVKQAALACQLDKGDDLQMVAI